MYNDVTRTFKPYKSNYHFYNDLLQPFHGVGNLLSGAFNFLIAPPIFVINTFRYAGMAIQQKSFGLFLDNMALNIVKNGGGFLDGVTRIIRGGTQILTTPLTYALRIPLRGIITLIKGKPTFADTYRDKAEKLDTLVNKEDKSADDTLRIDRSMHHLRTKFIRAEKRGQALGLDKEEFIKRFSQCSTFTEERLSTMGFLRAQFGGGISSSSYEYRTDDSLRRRKPTSNLLKLFTHRHDGDTEKEGLLDSDIETSNEERHEGNEILDRWDRVCDRKFF